MFEAVCIPGQLLPNKTLNVGYLAECLLYYGQVNLVGGGGLIAELVGSVGAVQTIELMERGYLRLHFEDQMLATHTHTEPTGEQFHNVVKFGVQAVNSAEGIRRALVKFGLENYQAKIMAARFSKRVENFAYPGYDFNWARNSLLDSRFRNAVIPEYLKQFAPDAPSHEIQFDVVEERKGLTVATNLDLPSLTRAFRSAYGANSGEVTPALILDALRRTADTQYLAASLNTEVFATPAVLAGSAVRLSEAIDKARASTEQIDVFQEFTIEGADSLQLALTSGKRTFDEFLEVLRKAERFKSWIRAQPPDINLLKSYHRDIANKSFIDRLPGKTSRFALFTGLGLAADLTIAGGLGTVAGVAVSAADQFLVDKLGFGWKPHHFVTGPLRDFVSPKRPNRTSDKTGP